MRKFKLLLLLFFYFITLNAIGYENLVYTWRGFPNHIAEGKIALGDLKIHAAQINILSSQAYHIDDKGLVYGAVNPQMTEIARGYHIKLMPLVGNKEFDRKLVHIFLNDPVAQQRAIQSVLQLCQQNHYAGVQIDFEGMSYLDRDAFTHFYQQISALLHKNHFLVAIAVVPILTEEKPVTPYLAGRYRGWTGCYDYKALGKSSDFLTLMAYDQHGSITTPGPMAGYTWDEAIIKVALKYIPARKILLGIPWHSGYWYTGKNMSTTYSTPNPIRSMGTTLTYEKIKSIINENNIKLYWDNTDKIHYAMYTNHFLYEYMFIEDAASFKAKLALVKKYHLRGIANWCLGEEDPRVWDTLTKFSHN